MPEPDRPPDNPPDEPIVSSGGPPTAGGAAAPTSPKAEPAPSFTAEQVGQVLEQGIERAFQRVLKPQAPAVSTIADTPLGPSVGELDSQIVSLNSEIDQAVANGGNVSALLTKRDHLRDQKFEIERVAPLRMQGGQSINEVVLDSIARSDPYFTKYKDEVMALIAPAIKQGTVLRLEMVKEATNLVKGRHTDEILATDREEIVRRGKIQPADMPGSVSGRSLSAAGAVAAKESVLEIFGDRAEAAFQSKRDKGIDEEAFARRLGYKDKREWFAKTREQDAGDHSFGLDKTWDRVNGKWIDPTQAR